MIKNLEKKDFEDCIEKINYTTKIKRKNFLETGQFPIISQEQEFINGYWNDHKDVFKVKKPVVVFGDHTQVVKYIDFDFVLGADGVKILQPKNGLNPKYFYYCIVNTNIKELGYARHYRLLKEIQVPIPFLTEQKRIVKILDEVFEKVTKVKENAEKNLQNTRELFESYLHNVFANPGDGWKEKQLGEVCKISSKLVDPRRQEYINQVHVGAGNIEEKTGALVNLKTAKEEKLKSGKFPFNKTMVLYSKIRPYLMKVVRPDFQGLCSADIYPLLTISNQMLRNYLFYLLLTPRFTQYAIQGSARAGMPKVNRPHLFAFSCKVPPLDEQATIVEKLDKISLETKKLETIYQQKIAGLEELKKSILQKAFTGELVGAQS